MRQKIEEPHIKFHDVDNRLKDIMDSLQGRMGGSKKEQLFERLIPNDSQIQSQLKRRGRQSKATA
jgi:hypothetical protein